MSTAALISLYIISSVKYIQDIYHWMLPSEYNVMTVCEALLQKENCNCSYRCGKVVSERNLRYLAYKKRSVNHSF